VYILPLWGHDPISTLKS